MSLEEVVCLIAEITNRKPTVYGNWFKLHCPAHEDKKPSLGVKEINNGRILIRCFAGCDFYDICRAIGIHSSVLAPKR